MRLDMHLCRERFSSYANVMLACSRDGTNRRGGRHFHEESSSLSERVDVGQQRGVRRAHFHLVPGRRLLHERGDAMRERHDIGRGALVGYDGSKRCKPLSVGLPQLGQKSAVAEN